MIWILNKISLVFRWIKLCLLSNQIIVNQIKFFLYCFSSKIKFIFFCFWLNYWLSKFKWTHNFFYIVCTKYHAVFFWILMEKQICINAIFLVKLINLICWITNWILYKNILVLLIQRILFFNKRFAFLTHSPLIYFYTFMHWFKSCFCSCFNTSSG